MIGVATINLFPYHPEETSDKSDLLKDFRVLPYSLQWLSIRTILKLYFQR